jgi:hypothetical protein
MSVKNTTAKNKNKYQIHYHINNITILFVGLIILTGVELIMYETIDKTEGLWIGWVIWRIVKFIFNRN